MNNGRVTFIDNLVKQMRDTSLEAKADSKIAVVVGARGQALDRHSLLQIERGCMSEVRILYNHIPLRCQEILAGKAPSKRGLVKGKTKGGTRHLFHRICSFKTSLFCEACLRVCIRNVKKTTLSLLSECKISLFVAFSDLLILCSVSCMRCALCQEFLPNPSLRWQSCSAPSTCD